ncbi:unnamed protein product [Ectocarpus sp. 12 AP-2014]
MEAQNQFLTILPGLIGSVFFLFGISVMLFLQISRNAALKRKLFRYSLVIMMPLALGFFWTANAPLPMVLGFIPGVIIIALMNLRMVSFCDSCGKTLVNYNLFFRHKFCTDCGASLQ